MGSDSSFEARPELRRLLDIAEDYQDRYEHGLRRLSTLRGLQSLMIALGLVGGLVVLTTASSVGWPIAAALATICTGYAVTVEFVLRTRLLRRTERDYRALREVIEVVREVEHVTSIEERWSPLERAEFRIRLSRFEA